MTSVKTAVQTCFSDCFVTFQAMQLIKAVSMLLKFSTEEQRLIQDTLEWRMSWFGVKPPLERGKHKVVTYY